MAGRLVRGSCFISCDCFSDSKKGRGYFVQSVCGAVRNTGIFYDGCSESFNIFSLSLVSDSAYAQDVSADGYIVELSQQEAPEKRGNILTTSQIIKYSFFPSTDAECEFVTGSACVLLEACGSHCC